MPQSTTLLKNTQGALLSFTGLARHAIDEKWRSLGGAPGPPTVPGDRGVVRVGLNAVFREYANGRIYYTGDAFWVHGAVLARYMQLGGPGSWLGLPQSDELDLPEDGKVGVFQNGSIYWWPDVGARDINNVVVHYTGMHCFGETDFDHGSSDDEPYATLGVVAPDGSKQTFRSRIYEGVDAGEGRFEIIELYRGKPLGLAIGAILQEHSGDDTELSRQAMTEALDKGGPALAEAAKRIPLVGPVLGPLAQLAYQVFKEDPIGALNSLVENTLGLADLPLGSDFIELTPKQMVVLATRPEGDGQFKEIPWRFETNLLQRFGASYKLYFNVFPV